MSKIEDPDPIPKMDECPWRDEHTDNMVGAKLSNTPYGKPIAYRQCPDNFLHWRVREWKLADDRIVREVRRNLLDVFPRSHNHCAWFGEDDLAPVFFFPYMFTPEQVEEASKWHSNWKSDSSKL